MRLKLRPGSFSLKRVSYRVNMTEQVRESWRSKFGFMMAAVGSAVGLVNIWRFPYIVAEHGGGAFICIYIIFLFLIGYPVLISEVSLGRTAGRGPSGALRNLAPRSPRAWARAGLGIVLTGFLVASFYSVIAGWIVGYTVEAASGSLSTLTNIGRAKAHFQSLISNPYWCLGYHALFMTLSMIVLHRGVRKGIELANRYLMPLLVALLVILMIWGLTLTGSEIGLNFLFKPNWSLLTPIGILTALGHAFFTLSLGQGTMITYGSYLSKRDHIPRICAPIVIADTLIALLAGIAVLSIVYGSGESADQGFALLFSTLPAAFSDIPAGGFMAPIFFFLVALAAITSQTSAMEPFISYLMDEKGWRRPKAVLAVGTGAFILGIPSALAFNALSDVTLFGGNLFEVISNFAMDILIPLGGLVAIVYVGWVWGLKKAYQELPVVQPFFRGYLDLTIRYLAPILIALILLTSIGII